MTLVLIVDDVAAMRDQYAYDLNRLGGFETHTANGGTDALDRLDREAVDCVILDLEMPGMDGLEVLEAMKQRLHPAPVIVYTGTGDYARCVRALRLGAYSFLDKSEPMERVVLEVENALRHRRLTEEVSGLRARLAEESPLLGSSRPMGELRRTLARLAPIPSPVLILGESGTGKELAARELHRLGARPEGPFLALNAAALPETLVESELFGHEAGAFTGADRLHRGAFESASGGTLFLDEIGELSQAAQAKLLRVLEGNRITRVGGSKPVAVSARIVAATNRDLDAEATEGRFREDLFYRIGVHVVRVPALRERLEDVPELVRFFLDTASRRLGVRAKSIAPEALGRLQARRWERNNVRELRNVVERLLIASEGPRIEVSDLPREPGVVAAVPSRGTLRERKVEAERSILLDALERHAWRIGETAAALGLADHASLLKIMRRHGLRKPSATD